MKEEIMVDAKDYDLMDYVEMKKPHPCQTKCKIFQIIRLGADIKIKCTGCGNVIMLSREDFHKKLKKIIKEEK